MLVVKYKNSIIYADIHKLAYSIFHLFIFNIIVTTVELYSYIG